MLEIKGISVSSEQYQNSNVEPFVFSDEEEASSVEELIKISEKLPQQGIDFLMGGNFEKWLAYIGRNDLAEIAISARSSPDDAATSLRQFIQSISIALSSSQGKEKIMSSQVAQIFYVQDYRAGQQSRLYELNIKTGKATLIGEIGTDIYDLALIGSDLYALDKRDFKTRRTMNLIKVDRRSGATQVVGNIGYDLVGMAYNPNRGKLYATAHQNYQIIEIDLNTGKGKVAVTLSDRDRLVGEIAFNSEGALYITLTGTDLKKYLATCNLDAGEVKLIGDTYFPGLASMKFVGNTLYGVGGQYEGVGGSNGQLIRIDTNTGSGSLLFKTEPALCWAGMAILEQSTVTVGSGSGSGSSTSSTATTQSSSGSMTTGSVTGGTVTTGTTTTVSSSTSAFMGSGATTSEEINFTFSFDDSQMEQAWQQIAAQVDAAVTVTGEQDATVEARRWDQLETWLLTGYKAQAKELAMKVARLELMLDTFKQQLEGNLQLTFRRWSTYFDGRLQNLVNAQIVQVTQGSLNVAIEQLKMEILNQTTQLVQTEVNRLITNQINSLRTEINKNIETRITTVQAEINKNIETQITTVQTEINKNIESQITTVQAEINKNIETQITNVTTEINKNINVTNVVTNEVSESITANIRKGPGCTTLRGEHQHHHPGTEL